MQKYIIYANILAKIFLSNTKQMLVWIFKQAFVVINLFNYYNYILISLLGYNHLSLIYLLAVLQKYENLKNFTF